MLDSATFNAYKMHIAVSELPAAEVTGPVIIRGWNLATRLIFRFVFCYFSLFSLPSPGRMGVLTLIPGGSFIAEPIQQAWAAFIPWIAVHVIHFNGPIRPMVGGDRASDYLQVLTIGVLALVLAVLWSVVGRRAAHPQLHAVLRLLLRCYLFQELFLFGINKIIPLQFPAPPLERLLQPLGRFTPAALLWAFMGSSTAYEILSGVAEVIAAVLLLFRRTVTLGALIAVGVLTNVVALNFSYDLGVKLFSTHLLVMTLILLAPAARELTRFFVLAAQSQVPQLDPAWLSVRRFRPVLLLAAATCLVWFTFTNTQTMWANYQRVLSWRNTPLFGIYEVETFTRNGELVPPLLADTVRWRRVYVQSPTSFAFYHMNDSPDWYRASYDAAQRRVLLLDRTTRRQVGQLTYSIHDENRVNLDGRIADDTFSIVLRRVDSSWPLVSDRFHWVHETPPSAQ